jgi:hypothetical protein
MWSYVVRTTAQPTTLPTLPMLLQHRSRTVRHGRKALVQLGRKAMPSCGPQPSPFAVRFGCKVVARSRPQIDTASTRRISLNLRSPS